MNCSQSEVFSSDIPFGDHVGYLANLFGTSRKEVLDTLDVFAVSPKSIVSVIKNLKGDARLNNPDAAQTRPNTFPFI